MKYRVVETGILSDADKVLTRKTLFTLSMRVFSRQPVSQCRISANVEKQHTDGIKLFFTYFALRAALRKRMVIKALVMISICSEDPYVPSSAITDLGRQNPAVIEE